MALGGKGRVKTDVSHSGTAVTNGRACPQRLFSDRPCKRPFHFQDRVLVNGSHHVLGDGPVSQGAKWQSRPGGVPECLRQIRRSSCSARQTRPSSSCSEFPGPLSRVNLKSVCEDYGFVFTLHATWESVMQLPFSADQFFAVIRQYNEAVWPAQVLVLLLGLVAIAFLLWKRSWSSVGISGILALLWTWMRWHTTLPSSQASIHSRMSSLPSLSWAPQCSSGSACSAANLISFRAATGEV